MVRPAGTAPSGSVALERDPDAPPPAEVSPPKASPSDERTGPSGPGPNRETRDAARARAAHDVTAQQLQRAVAAKVTSANETAAPAPVDAAAPAPVEAFRAGHSAGQLVYEHGRAALDLGYAEATRLAQQGRPVRPGGSFTVRHQGRNIEYRDVQYQQFNDGYAASFRVQDGDTDMRYEMSERSGRFSARGRGTIAHDDESYTVDLRYRGSRDRQFDTTGAASVEQYAVSGSVRTDDWQLTLDERYQLRSQTGNVRTVGHGTASSVQRTINNTLVQGDDTFRWQGVHTRGSFRSNQAGALEASSPTEWSAEGRVTRNGEAYGRYELQRQAGQLRVRLQTPSETVVLDRFSLRRD